MKNVEGCCLENTILLNIILLKYLICCIYCPDEKLSFSVSLNFCWKKTKGHMEVIKMVLLKGLL